MWKQWTKTGNGCFRLTLVRSCKIRSAEEVEKLIIALLGDKYDANDDKAPALDMKVVKRSKRDTD